MRVLLTALAATMAFLAPAKAGETYNWSGLMGERPSSRWNQFVLEVNRRVALQDR